jgi:pimeloyl-ACP methyl ester carboxylesterase
VTVRSKARPARSTKRGRAFHHVRDGLCSRYAMRRSLWLILVMLAAACEGRGCMPPSWGAGALLYPHKRAVDAAPGAPHRELRVQRDGVELRGWLFAAAAPARGTLVSLHGTGDNRASSIGLAKRFTALGYDVLAYDSRGHGDSSGDYCTYGVHEKDDLKRMLDEARARPIVLFGRSLGAAVALQAAAEDERIAGVVAVSTFSDLRTIAIERAPFIAGARDIEEAFAIAEQRAHFRVADASPLRAAALIRVPVLLIHGAEDTETPPAHSQRVHTALRGRKQLVLVPGRGHTNVLNSELWSRVEAFVAGI